MHTQGAPMSQPMAPHGAVNQFPSSSWGLKGNDAGSSSHEMPPALGLGQISQPLNSQFSGELEVSQDSQQGRRQYMELEHSSPYDSSPQQIHWSL